MNAELILLAGGRSSRMNQPKGLLPYKGRPWVVEQIRRFRSLGGSGVNVVLGYQAEAYRDVLPADVAVILNPAPEWGPFSSIVAGANQALEHGAPAAFVLPVDIPCPEPVVWRALLETLAGDTRTLAAVPEFQGRGGHPVLLSRAFLERLTGLPLDAPDSRLDLQLRGLSLDVLARVRVDDPGICKDLNTPAEWSEFEKS